MFFETDVPQPVANVVESGLRVILPLRVEGDIQHVDDFDPRVRERVDVFQVNEGCLDYSGCDLAFDAGAEPLLWNTKADDLS